MQPCNPLPNTPMFPDIPKIDQTTYYDMHFNWSLEPLDVSNLGILGYNTHFNIDYSLRDIEALSSNSKIF